MKKLKQSLTYSALRATTILTIVVVFSLGCSSKPKQERIRVPDVPPPISKKIENVRVALVLSSGGFRGAAHIGVIEVLEEHNIPIDLIVGTSAGSFIGAFYADEPNAVNLKNKLLYTKYEELIDTSWIRAIQSTYNPTGPVRGLALQKFMLDKMRSRNFEDLIIPLIVVTASLKNNQMEVLQTGPIIPAVHASSAIPPYFAPVNVYENTYIDGGVIAPVPVSIAKLYNPKLTIAVDICKRPSLAELNNMFQITGRAIDISFSELATRQAKAADIVIRPDIIGYGPFEAEYNQEFYEAGRRAALEKIEEVKQAYAAIAKNKSVKSKN